MVFELIGLLPAPVVTTSSTFISKESFEIEAPSRKLHSNGGRVSPSLPVHCRFLSPFLIVHRHRLGNPDEARPSRMQSIWPPDAAHASDPRESEVTVKIASRGGGPTVIRNCRLIEPYTADTVTSVGASSA
jgi:hypothetical protein